MYATQIQGTAQSSWGLGSSPYAVAPAPADGANQVENRQGANTRDDPGTSTFEPLYAPEEYEHSFSSEQHLKGQMDLTQPPAEVQEIRSAPETQEALAEYVAIIGALAEGEESAIQLEQVPIEYRELVKEYFSQLEAAAAKEKAKEKSGK